MKTDPDVFGNDSDQPPTGPGRRLVEVALDAIRMDGPTQSRVETSQVLVAEYSELVKHGVALPPPVLFLDQDGNYWPGDGHHTILAYGQAGRVSILAEVRNGTVRDAIIFSVGANAAHGLRRSNADKRRAVATLIRDSEWARWSDRQIAQTCKVSHPFVSQVRKEHAAGDPDATKPTSVAGDVSTPAPLLSSDDVQRPDAPGSALSPSPSGNVTTQPASDSGEPNEREDRPEDSEGEQSEDAPDNEDGDEHEQDEPPSANATTSPAPAGEAASPSASRDSGQAEEDAADEQPVRNTIGAVRQFYTALASAGRAAAATRALQRVMVWLRSEEQSALAEPSSRIPEPRDLSDSVLAGSAASDEEPDQIDDAMSEYGDEDPGDPEFEPLMGV